MAFHYFLPTTVECGIGLSRKIGEILKKYQASSVLLVTDQGVRRAGLLGPIEESLKKNEISYTIFDKTEPNPSAESIMDGLEHLKNLPSCDFILAVGGGSSIDTAKAIGIMSKNEGHILDYEGVGKILNPGIPLIAIPTTAGTGSEVTASTIVTNTKTQFKTAVISEHIYPKVAILDASLTERLPSHITAATGMDALTHAIESYTSKTATPISQAFALQAIRLIGKNILPAYFIGIDLISRENMLVASMLAGAAFSQSRLGNVHAISHTLGGVFGIPHGIANAALLPFVMRFNLPACPEKFRDIAETLGEDISQVSTKDAAEKAIQAVIRFNVSMGIPLNIRDLGVSLDHLPKLVEDSMRSGNVLVNPRLTNTNDIQLIIENAYHGILD